MAAQRLPIPELPNNRVDAGDVTLAWGDAGRWKAALRRESLDRHLALPVGERLRIALAMVLPRQTRDRSAP